MLKYRAPIAAAIFIIMLIIPVIAQLLSGANTKVSELENRTLASWPSGTVLVNDWPAYPGQAEDWMGDHLGLRAWLIGVNRYMRERLDLKGVRRAVRGDDGWLFSDVNDVIAMHRGLRPFEPGGAQAWLETATELQTRAAKQGAAFAVLIGPNKHEVYTEYLTAYEPVSRIPRRAEVLAELANETGITLVYPLAEMRAARHDYQLYYKTDSHWTQEGAFIAYRELMEQLQMTGLVFPTVDEDDFDGEGIKDKLGDIHRLLGEVQATPEQVMERVLADPKPVSQVVLEGFSWAGIEATQTTTRLANNGSNGLSILILGDSYYAGIAPFLEQSFDEVTFVHNRYLSPSLEILESHDFDLIVLLTVERMLINPLRLDEDD